MSITTTTTRLNHRNLNNKTKAELADIVLWICDSQAPLVAALRKAYHELNTIHARDGIPWTGVPCPMPTDVTQEYFTSVVEECRKVLKDYEDVSVR